MKKLLCLMLSSIMVLASLTACGKGSAKEPTEGYVTMNGTNVVVGTKFADIEGKLGEPTQPAQDVIPCDGDESSKDILHFYEGLCITEHVDGVITALEIGDYYGDTSKVKAQGKVTIPATTQGVIDALGDPENEMTEDDFSLVYTYGKTQVMFFMNPDDRDEIFSLMMMLRE